MSTSNGLSPSTPDPVQAWARDLGLGRLECRDGWIRADARAARLLGWRGRRRRLDPWLREWPGDEQARWLQALQAPRRRTRLALDWPGAPPLRVAAEVARGGFVAWLRPSAPVGSPQPAAGAARSAGDTLCGVAVAQVGHELRTPLNAIHGFAELLRREPLEAPAAARVARIADAAQLMRRVVDDLLDCARLQAGRLEIDAGGALWPARILSAVGHTAPVLVAGEGVEVHLRLDPTCPQRLRGDPQRLEQVLLNLVANAARHTVRGEIVVACRVQATGPDAVRLRWVVSDTGVGIPAAHLAALGAPFVQVAPAAGGSGLGLSVVHQLLELMGSRLHVVSVLGGGTLAWFDLALPLHPATTAGPDAPRSAAVIAADRRWAQTLAVHLAAAGEAVVADPVAAATWYLHSAHPDAGAWQARAAREGRRCHRLASPLPPAREPASRPAHARRPLQGLRVLVVDDSAMNRELLAQLLAGAGASVTLAADVAQALALAAAQRFDAAVLDIQLPGGDGRGLATQLQGIEPGRPLPVVFVTASVGAEDADGARTPGVLGCLPKPFDPERLVGLLRRAAAGQAGPAAAASGPGAAPAAVAALFRREWPQLARAVRQARSRERLAQAVHALRGALAWMGDRAALALAAEVESGLHAGRERRGLPLRALLKRARALAGD